MVVSCLCLRFVIEVCVRVCIRYAVCVCRVVFVCFVCCLSVCMYLRCAFAVLCLCRV